jgi:uncharacterized protein YggE
MNSLTRPKLLLALVLALSLLAFTIACGNSSGDDVKTPTTTGNSPNVTTVAGSVPQGNDGPVSEASAPRSSAFLGSVNYGSYGSYNGLQEGIFVTGTGTVSVQPDMAVLSIGVNATADTVKEAMNKANTSLNAMLEAVKKHGVDSKDIQTSYFSVYPRYDGYEIYNCPKDGGSTPPSSDPSVPEGGCYREWKQVLTGYQVANQLTIKVRGDKEVGPVIDDLVVAGGDAAQIQGITFTVEDTKALSAKAREAAIKAAMEQAQQFASLTGAGLGKLIHISQVGGEIPVTRAYKDVASAPGGEFAPTPIQTGEVEVTVTVQAVFAIN